MKLSNKPVINPVVVLREEFDDWAVLFNPDTAEAVGINPVGVAIWKLLNGKRNLEGIVTDIQDRFEQVPETAKSEVAEFINELTDRGFAGYDLKNWNK